MTISLEAERQEAYPGIRQEGIELALWDIMGCILQESEQRPYICINCGNFLSALYEQYGESHIRLSLCEHCNNVADKYIEYDNVLLFIDLILIKPGAYRHTIYNVFLASSSNMRKVMAPKTKLNRSTTSPSAPALSLSASNLQQSVTGNSSCLQIPGSGSERSRSIMFTPLIFRLGILMLLFEVYITWAYQEKSFFEKPLQTSLIISLVLKGPIQYIYFLSITILQNSLLCVSLTYFAGWWLPFGEAKPKTSIGSSGNQNIYLDSAGGFSPLSSRPASPLNKFNGSQSQHLRLPKNIQRGKSYYGTGTSTTLQVPSTGVPQKSRMISLDVPNSKNIDQKINDVAFHHPSPPSFKKIFRVIMPTVLISNIVKLFPIVMLIWPYDSPILHATRLLVRIVHLLLLIEAIHIVFIDPKNAKRMVNLGSSSPSYPNSQTTGDYYRITAIVLVSEFVRIAVSHIVVVFVASAVWGISVREIGLDDWKMFKVGIRMLEELGEYILGEV